MSGKGFDGAASGSVGKVAPQYTNHREIFKGGDLAARFGGFGGPERFETGAGFLEWRAEVSGSMPGPPVVRAFCAPPVFFA
jgi:hypothetical protein